MLRYGKDEARLKFMTFLPIRLTELPNFIMHWWKKQRESDESLMERTSPMIAYRTGNKKGITKGIISEECYRLLYISKK